MPGPNDDNIPWPIKRKFTVELLNKTPPQTQDIMPVMLHIQTLQPN